jgi:hypothetical protein
MGVAAGMGGMVALPHMFKERTYMKPTYCGVCRNFLKGLVRHGGERFTRHASRFMVYGLDA